MNEANRPARRSNIIFCLSCFRLTTLPALLLERYHIRSSGNRQLQLAYRTKRGT